MRRHHTRLGLMLTLAAAFPAALGAQGSPAATGPIPQVGDQAPDFVLPVSTKEGQGNVPARLRDFRGQTVVLAFFPKARTGG